MNKEKLQQLQNDLIQVRNSCLSLGDFDPDGAVILSHAIRWFSFKIEGKPYEQLTD